MADFNLDTARVVVGFEKNPDGTDNHNKPVYWEFGHVLRNMRGGEFETQQRVAKVEALVNALADKMLTAEEITAAIEAAKLTISTDAQVNLSVTAGGAA